MVMQNGAFEFEVLGEVQMARAMSRFADVITDWRPAYEDIADDFLVVERQQFDSTGSSGDTEWPALSPRYAARKQATYGDLPIMVVTGELRDSLTKESDPNHIREIERMQLRLGSTVAHGVFHQSPEPRTVLPRRPLIALTDKIRVRWTKILQRYAVSEARNLGFLTGRQQRGIGAGTRPLLARERGS